MRRGSQVKSLTLTRLSAIIRAIQNLNQMKYMKKQLRLSGFVFAGLLAVSAFNSRAALYKGNGIADSDGAVGNGSMDLSVNSGSLSVNFHAGVNTIQDNLVLFIDSVPGGYNGTVDFYAYGGVNTIISGYDGSRRSTAVFAPGLYADYAIIITPDNIGLYALGTDSFTQKSLVPVTHSLNNYSGNIDLSLMELSGTSTYFKFQSSDVGRWGNRFLESFETTSGTKGLGGTITFANYNEFGTPPVPEPVNVALGVFGLLACGGGIISGWRRRRTKR